MGVRAQSVADAQTRADTFIKTIRETNTGFATHLEELRIAYVSELQRLEEKAKRGGRLTEQLWTARYRRKAEERKGTWIALVADPYDLPESVRTLNRATEERFTSLRNTSIRKLEDTKTKTLESMTAAEKALVRLDHIKEALEVRKLAEAAQRSGLYEKVRKRLGVYTLENMVKRHWKKEKNDLPDGGPTPPPDAEFPFLSDNPAFQAFLNSVRVESSGFHEGPSAVILIGRMVTYHGARGVSMVACHNEAVILTETYDTYANPEESLRLAKDIGELPYGSFVVLAVRDDATRRFSGSAQSALYRLGAKKGIQKLPYRSSYYLIGIKGLLPGQAVERDSLKKIQYNPEA